MRLAKTGMVSFGVGVLGILAASPAVATTSQTAKSGTEYFLIAEAGNTQTVVAHGLFTGGGRDDASHENYDILHLGGGTLRVNHPDAQSKFTQHINPKSCFITFKITGKYTLSDGTGRFAGVTGHGNYVVSEQGILARDKKGACSQEQEPITQAGEVTASGPATLG
jgi:hypothetical protein